MPQLMPCQEHSGAWRPTTSGAAKPDAAYRLASSCEDGSQLHPRTKPETKASSGTACHTSHLMLGCLKDLNSVFESTPVWLTRGKVKTQSICSGNEPTSNQVYALSLKALPPGSWFVALPVAVLEGFQVELAPPSHVSSPEVDDVVFNYDPRDMKDYMWRRHLEDRGKVAVKHLPSAGDPCLSSEQHRLLGGLRSVPLNDSVALGRAQEMQNWLQMSDTQAPEETAFGSRSYGTLPAR